MWKWQICHICLFFLSHQFHSHFLNGLADKRWRRGITKRVNLMAQPPSPGQGIIITMLIAIAKITATMFYVMIMMVVMFRLMVMFLVLTHLSWVLSWGLERQNRKRKYNVCFSGDSFEFNYSNGKMQVRPLRPEPLSRLWQLTRTSTTIMTKNILPEPRQRLWPKNWSRLWCNGSFVLLKRVLLLYPQIRSRQSYLKSIYWLQGVGTFHSHTGISEQRT